MSWRLNEREALITRVLADGRVLDLFPQFYNWRLTISSSANTLVIEDEW